VPEVRDAVFSQPGCALRSVIHECDTIRGERFHAVVFEGVVGSTVKMLRAVIERGTGRREVRADAVNGYVLDVVQARTVYRSKVCGSEWPDVDPEEMIDRLMVPLPRSAGS